MEAKDQIHSQIVKNLSKVSDWFAEKRGELHLPIYTSYDIRDAGFKAAVVDANIYPAGFNNICQVDKENSPELFSKYIEGIYGAGKVQKVALLTEEHTNNPYYWENISSLSQMISEAGYELRVCMPKELPESPLSVTSVNGNELQVYSALRDGTSVSWKDFTPDIIVSNNDFSEPYEEWSLNLSTPVNPPRELGWYRRKKSCYFEKYNQVVEQFAGLIEVDPWLLQVETKSFEGFDLSTEDVKNQLSQQVDDFLKHTAEKYAQHGIQEKPFLMMKNNSGTYGLAVIQVHGAEDILNFNYKSRKKMKAAKGGRSVEEVILQEGIPSSVSSDGITAEPAIYMVGCGLAGGFLRAHGKKGKNESLNSPGAVYKRLCVSDLDVSVEGHPLENVYGWLARLGLMAIGLESEAMGVTYPRT